MVKNQFILRPLDALASTSSSSEPLLCKFALKPRNDHSCIFSLQASFVIQDLDNTQQTLTILYLTEALKPNTLVLNDLERLPGDTDQIARGGNPQWKTLTFKTVELCPIVCSFPEGTRLQQGTTHDGPLDKFVNLARATEVFVTFDFNHLHRDKQAQFDHFLELNQSPTLDDLAVDLPKGAHLAKNHQFVFGTTRTSEPPPYRKRSISPATAPPAKRILHTPEPIPAPSPTEKATTNATSTPSPGPLFSPIQLSIPNRQHDAVEDAVEKYLPTIAGKILLTLLPPVENHIHSIFSKAHDHADERHATADNEFLESLEDYKAEARLYKDDCMSELQTEGEAMVRKFQAQVTKMVDEAGQTADERYSEFLDRCPDLVLYQLEQRRLRGQGNNRERNHPPSVSSSQDRSAPATSTAVSFDIPGLLRDEALFKYYTWQCTQVCNDDWKSQYKLAYELARAKAFDLELIHRDRNVKMYTDQGVSEGIARRFVGDVEEFIRDYQR